MTHSFPALNNVKWEKKEDKMKRGTRMWRGEVGEGEGLITTLGTGSNIWEKQLVSSSRMGNPLTMFQPSFKNRATFRFYWNYYYHNHIRDDDKTFLFFMLLQNQNSMVGKCGPLADSRESARLQIQNK